MIGNLLKRSSTAPQPYRLKQFGLPLIASRWIEKMILSKNTVR
jgi:hypothetical protein